ERVNHGDPVIGYPSAIDEVPTYRLGDGNVFCWPLAEAYTLVAQQGLQVGAELVDMEDNWSFRQVRVPRYLEGLNAVHVDDVRIEAGDLHTLLLQHDAAHCTMHERCAPGGLEAQWSECSVLSLKGSAYRDRSHRMHPDLTAQMTQGNQRNARCTRT